MARVARRRRQRAEAGPPVATPLPVPVIVVGNVIVGGAGKTPTVIALVAQLRAWGCTPGIISRGYGREGDQPRVLEAATPGDRPDRSGDAALAREVGDEPLLMHRRTGAPVAVARRRLDAARTLLARHPEVDVVVSDDGLQHHALPRDLEIVVFDGRGLGNGQVLPAGPLREPPDALWPSHPQGAAASPRPARVVLLNGDWPAPPAPALPVPAAQAWAARRALAGAVSLADWARGVPPSPGTLAALRGRPLVAAAGIGEPGRFFAMADSCGLDIRRLPLPDHASFDPLPWAPGTPDVVVTEKDAVKLAGRPLGGTRVWVLPLDFQFDPGFAAAVRVALDQARARRRAGPASPPTGPQP